MIEDPERWIAAVAIVVIVLSWAGARASLRRRLARFDDLARAFDTHAVHEHEHLLRFNVTMENRKVDVRYQHQRYGWFLVTAIPLANVLDTHSAEVRPVRRAGQRSDLDGAGFERHFAIDDYGYPLREGWTSVPVRDALYAFYGMRVPLVKLVIEKGELLHRSPLPLHRFQHDMLRSLISHQVEVAEALERAL